MRTARRELSLQVLPLIRQLTGRDWDREDFSDRPNLGTVEAVATPHGLVVDCRQVRVHGQAWMGMCLEPRQLWVMEVTPCLTAKDRFGQERFTP